MNLSERIIRAQHTFRQLTEHGIDPDKAEKLVVSKYRLMLPSGDIINFYKFQQRDPKIAHDRESVDDKDNTARGTWGSRMPTRYVVLGRPRKTEPLSGQE